MATQHSHPDFEVNYVHSGRVVYLHGGGCVELEAGRFTAFWGGLPHVNIGPVPEETRMSWITIPLADAMQWGLPPDFIGDLLLGRVAQAEGIQQAKLDGLLLAQWEDDWRAPEHRRQLARADIANRFRRLALSGTASPHTPLSSTGARKTAARAFENVARNYLTVSSTSEVAESLGVHTKYLMQSFKRVFGIGIWEYVMRMRIAHAQRLLLTTNQPVDVVADACGFRTTSAFYRAFSRFSQGMSPARFRRLS